MWHAFPLLHGIDRFFLPHARMARVSVGMALKIIVCDCMTARRMLYAINTSIVRQNKMIWRQHVSNLNDFEEI